MKKITFVILALPFLFGIAYCAQPAPKSAQIKDIPPFKKGERILILAPHPDDEAIGCAGIIQQALSAGAEVEVTYLTCGDHNEFAFIVYEKRPVLRKGEFIRLGEVRRKEAVKAMASLGLSESNLAFLGYPDFGTFAIFCRFWQAKTPYKSILTRITKVPYKESPSFGAPYVGESILQDIKRVIRDFRPQKIFVSHPADTNPDHKALPLFLEVALSDLKRELPAPEIYFYLIHHRAWPLPRHYRPKLSLQPPQAFLDSDFRWRQFKLAPEQINKKYRAILAYRSQTASSAFYLLSFARQNELFSDFPAVGLQKQEQAGAKEAAFCGFSRMFPGSAVETAESLEELVRDDGMVSYAEVEDFLLIRIEKPEMMRRRFSAIIYLFGYSDKVPFAQMPKIRIVTKYNLFRIFNKEAPVNPKGVELELNHRALILKIPLQVLGRPDFVLSSVKRIGGVAPADASSFRKVLIKK